jgi:tRNA 2-thiouridine synthesizing protein A
LPAPVQQAEPVDQEMRIGMVKAGHEPALELDLRGLKCPLPVLRARRSLRGLVGGSELSLVATDPMAAIDIPHMCHEDGHALLGMDRLDERTWRFRIRRGPSAEPAGKP